MFSIATALGLSLAAAPPNVPPEQVEALESEGKHRKAVALAEDAAEQHPQDYGWTLRAAWLRFQAGHFRRATAHYRRAAELSGGSLESRLGLAWSLHYDGHRKAAIAELEALKREFPEATEVDEALAFARARGPVAYAPWVSGTGQVYANHPQLERGIGLQGGIGLTIAEHYLLSASYGFARIGLDPTTTATAGANTMAGNGGGRSGNGNGNGFASSRTVTEQADQHQAHVVAGVAWTTGGALVQYGYLFDEGLNSVHALGTSMRWSPWGDIVLSTSVTLEPNTVRPRIEPSWKLPVHEHIWLRPVFAMQVDGGVLPTGMLTAALHGRIGAVWVGGKYGRERRPAYLEVPTIFNIPGEVRWGAWVGGRIALASGLGLFASYEVDGIEPEYEHANAQAHFISAGVSFLHQ